MNYTPLWTKVLRVLVLLLVLAGSFAGLYIIFGNIDSGEKAKLYLESFKSLLYLITVLLVGAFITIVIKSLETDRKADKALHDFRTDFLNRLQSTHQRVMKSRHSLSAWGLTNRFGSLPPALSSNQSEIYEAEMAYLFEAVNDLERLTLEVERFPDSFSSHVQLALALKDMRRYLDELLNEYRQHWPQIQPTPNQFVVNKLVKLLDFTGNHPQSEYQKWVAVAYEKALTFVRQDLLPLKKAV